MISKKIHKVVTFTIILSMLHLSSIKSFEIIHKASLESEVQGSPLYLNSNNDQYFRNIKKNRKI